MKPGMKPAIVLLGVLGIVDLATVPFMIGAHDHQPGQPPAPAIAVAVIIGIGTLASAAGIAQGRKWAFGVAMTCRILDCISAVLGLLVRPSAVLAGAGAVTLVLSIAAIVLLFRVNPSRTLRHTASGISTQAQPEPSREATP